MYHLHRAVSALLVLVFLLAACAPPSTEIPSQVTEVAEVVDATQVPQVTEATEATVEEVSLRIWDMGTIEEDNQMYETLIEEFEATHPGVTVERTVYGPEDMQQVVKLALADPEGPDIVQINQGQQDMGEAVRAGLLVDLTPYVEEYDWYSRFAPSLASRNSYSADGETFGVGNLYGVSMGSELMGVFYREDIFAELGLAMPQTFEEFEAALATLKEAGYTPLAAAGQGGFAMMWMWTEIQNAYLGNTNRNWPNDFIYRQNDAVFDIPASLAASEKIVEWANAGYFTPGYEGYGYDEYTNSFKNGNEAMIIVGNWESGSMLALENGANIGFFAMPSLAGEGSKMTTGGWGIPFAIRAGSPNADLAAEYLDLLVSDLSNELQVALGRVPSSLTDTSIADDTVFGDSLRAWAEANKSDGIGHYLDWATPTMGETMNAAVTELLAGVISPQEFVEKVNANYLAPR